MYIPPELVAPIVAALIGGAKAVKFVHEGELGIKLRFGKATRLKDGNPKIFKPGFAFLIPFVDTLRRHHIRQQSMRFTDQRILLADGLIFKVSAMVIFKITDIYKALFEIDKVDDSIADLCMTSLRDVIQGCQYRDLSNPEDIGSRLLARSQQKASEWGAEIIQFGLTDCAPTAEAANLLNAKIAVEMKMEALDEACKKRKIPLADLNPTLAAALVGIPLTTGISDNRTSMVVTPVKREEPGLNISYRSSQADNL